MKYKIILFDADGVTLKHGQLFSEVLADQYGISLEKMTPFFTGVFQDCLIGKADVKKELIKVIDDWGWEGSVDDLMNFWFSTGDELDKDVTEFISKAKRENTECYLVTNQEKYRGQYLREKLSNFFVDAYVSGDIGYQKKDIEFFDHVYKEVGKMLDSKSQVLLIDDDMKNIDSAKRFGFDALYYQKPEDLLKIKLELAP